MIDKAEGDFIAALTLYRARKHPNYDTACYHTQQCAEKYLKARLEEAGQPIPRTLRVSSKAIFLRVTAHRSIDPQAEWIREGSDRFQ